MKILSDDGLLSQKAIDDIDAKGVIDGDIVPYLREQHKDTLRQVRDLLDGMENPHYRMLLRREYVQSVRWEGFNEAIKAMKALLEVIDGQGRTKTN